MDRTPFQLPFTVERLPPWPCPRCGKGHLTLDPKELLKKETAESANDREHDSAWEPDWVRYVFSCIFKCSNAECSEWIACCGIGTVTIIEYDDDEFGFQQSTEDLFYPKYFEPPLVLMDIPSTCPPKAIERLQESFALFFADPGAALNAARTAVEAVLTDLDVKRFAISSGQKRRLNLHQRILLLPNKHKALAELLLAVKWLGNAGSHDGNKPTSADVRIAYDLLEHVLSELYESKAKKLNAIAKKVNKKKGPFK